MLPCESGVTILYDPKHFITVPLVCAQELLYLSLKFVNNLWVLAELKITPGQFTLAVSHSQSCRKKRESGKNKIRIGGTDLLCFSLLLCSWP